MKLRELLDAPTAPFWIAAGAIVLMAAGVGFSHPYPAQTDDAPTPDMTVAECSVWADNVNPVLPAHTYTDRCIDTDGTVLYAQDPDVILTAPDTH